jgi:hypothetical protein
MPTEPGPAVGIGWALLRLGQYPEAEQAFRQTLAIWPGHALALEGLALLPLKYRFKFTLAGSVSPGQGNSLTGFVEYNHFHRTTVALGLQSARVKNSFQGFNTSLVVYRRLGYPWYARLDFLTLSAANDPRFWRLVYAPSLGRHLGEWNVRVTLVGWDRLGTAGLQLSGERRVWKELTAGAAPAVNLVHGKPGWFVPVSASQQVRPWLTIKVAGGFGSIADYADLDIPVLYSQAERFTATARVGLDLTIVKRCRVALFTAWERYEDAGRVFASLTLGVKL